MSKLITLSNGKQTIVDDEDFERLNAFRWNVSKNGRNVMKYYAMRTVQKKGVRTNIWMPYAVLGINRQKGKVIDHINGDSLDNRRSNLRLCSWADNSHNYAHRIQKTKDSKYKGIYFFKQSGKWLARIRFKNKLRHIGYFKDEIEGAKAYDREARRLFGEYARTNF